MKKTSKSVDCDSKPRIICLGAGGHASVLVDLLLALGDLVAVVGLIDHSSVSDVLGVPVVGSDEDLKKLARTGAADHFVVGIGSVRGGAKLRENAFERAQDCGLIPFTAMHPSAIVAPSVSLGAGTVVMAGAVIQARSRIGVNVIVNTNSCIDHDCTVSDHAHVAPGATCSGHVFIGRNAHVGTGAVIVQGVSIGEGATIGAGATVIRDCAPNIIVAGTPARVVTGSRNK